MAEALVLHEASMCSGCSQPRHLAWDDRSEGEFETVRHTCQACRQREIDTKDHKPGAGEYVTVQRLPPQRPAGAAHN